MRLSEPAGLLDVELLFLRQLRDRPRSRSALQDVMKTTCSMTKDRFITLHKFLSSRGYVTQSGESRLRQVFEITEKGKEAIDFWVTTLM